ncbi:MAG: UDP-glucose--hexose-1-phosphate uridylyltransferase [Clostridia bacterium]|nr:UDP-glucose--hexose-1-phosphate uridylyltransferase [Clostridia bacterium]MBQ6525459.1 UDP-glucose--hexose-1-phosphate uridylyltransferase [Clostridia bacterium]
MNKVYAAVGALANYAISHGLAEEADRHCLVNALLEKLGLDDYETVGDVPFSGLDDILDTLVDYAAEQGLLKSESITGRDLFDTALMGAVTPRPSEVIRTFRSLYGESPEKATDWFYQFSQDTNYIRATRVAKDIRWSVPSEFGDIDISINLSKPEKDPRDIAAAKTAKQSAYPKCQLCLENEGYAGRMDHPARQNHRIIPVTINESHWGFQYSPYVYYNEHCIVLNGEHVPMKIDRAAFRKLFDFVGQFPHYFLGSNADLPIVGGSILSHDHFQGGRYEFAMAKAPYESKFTVPGYEDIEAGIVHWPLSVIRLRGEDDERIIDLADHILKAWRGYTDEAAFIFAETDGEPHNTITPIARKRDGKFELDLALRNNITTDECPLGVYHPHAEYHHIKKENIGLIEVMGLAILPARLKTEIALLAECLTGDKKLEDYPELEQHAEWAKEIAARRTDLTKDTVDDILKEEIGHVFVHVLEDAGVYKCTDEGRAAFDRFIATL